jgi:hypothetical protein
MNENKKESMDDDGSMGSDRDDESIDSESTTGFDSVLPEIVIYTYRCYKLSTKSETAKKRIQDLYVKLVQLRTHQDKIRNEMEESTIESLCKVVARKFSFNFFKETTNFNSDMKSIVRFLESRLAILILHHRFVSNIFIYSVLDDEGEIRSCYDGVSEELTDCLWLIYTFSGVASPQLRTLHQAALKECNMIINYAPEFYPELDVLTNLIDKFVNEINKTNPQQDWMLLNINIRGQKVEDTDDDVGNENTSNK